MTVINQVTPITIPQLPAAAGLSGNEVLPVSQGGQAVKVAISALPQGISLGVVTYSGSGTAFPNGRTLAAGSGITLTDGGAGGNLTVSASGTSGTVTSVSVTTANGVSGSVATPTSTPAISLTLGAITPTSVNSVVLSGGSSPVLAVTGTSTIQGNNTGDQIISDATISITDITTNNVSTSKHGFTPKLPNDATKYLDGTGAYTVPSSASSAFSAITSSTNTTAAMVVGTGASIAATGSGTIVATSTTGNAATVTTNANLTGAITSVGNATSLGSFTSANLATALTDETGSGANVFANTPTLIAPILGTPSSGIMTNVTGTAAGLTAGTVTTNANLTGAITSVGNATTIANNAVTYGKIQATTQAALLGAASATNVGEITLGTNLSFSGSVLNATSTSAAAFSALTSSTNTTAAMVVGTGASLATSGSGSITASAVVNGIALQTPASGVMTNVTGTASGLTSGITNALKSASTTVDVSAATAPSTGQVLTATDSTHATWQTPASTSTVSVLAQSNVQVSHTGDTAETTLVDYTLPANTLPANGTLRITSTWTRNSGGTGTVTRRIRFSTISGTIYDTGTQTTAQTGIASDLNIIYANNATNSQQSPTSIGTTPFANTLTQVTSSVDTTSATHIVFTGQCANSGDTISLNSYMIELLHS